MIDDSDPRERDRWRELDRATGIAGILTTILLFTPIIAISTLGEPGFDASAAAAAEFFRAGDTAWVAAAGATAAIGMLAFVWFVAGLTTLLRRTESEPAWRSTVALVSGVLVAAYGVIDASWDAAFNRGDELNPAVAIFAFDLGNLGFANAWIALGSFAMATGWALLTGRSLAAWWGWWVIAAGAGLLAVRYAWESYAWTIPYFIFWAWVLAIAIRLIARPSGSNHRQISRRLNQSG
jgi:hypothetical protein